MATACSSRAILFQKFQCSGIRRGAIGHQSAGCSPVNCGRMLVAFRPERLADGAKDLLGTVPIDRTKEVGLSGSIHKNVRLVPGLAQSLHRLGSLPVEFAGFVVNLQLKIRVTPLAE